MIGERIKRARIARGLSQREVAKRAQLSAMAISKFERGEATPTSTTLIRLARALETPAEFFFRPQSVRLGKVEYRKRGSLGKKQLARIEADVVDQVERFLELLALFPTPPVRPFELPAALPASIDTMDDIEAVAFAVREAWQLGQHGIPVLADKLEEHGVIVFVTDVEDGGKFDGLAAKVSNYPVIVVGADWPGDRQRFTLAHELGHLLFAGRLADTLRGEAACNRFAGAFLVPGPTITAELGSHRNHIELRELYQLKHEYGLSMLALVYRARDVGIITSGVADVLFRTFSSRGWRKHEPDQPCPTETPHLFERLVMHALAEDMISTSKAAELMSMPLEKFRARLDLESPHAAAHR
jgi:Zn-dependent peptidase ImmA (M78 family)/transcriptional regulator with XRE-family HTH domain